MDKGLLMFVTIILMLSDSFANEDILEVRVEQGVLRGKYQESSKGKKFRAFTGIPYAKPPIGELRFQAPVLAAHWEGVRNATQLHAVCLQSNPLAGKFETIGEEDCLFLNVYTSRISSADNNALPVMFYVHGGGFVSGSAGPDWYEPDNFLDKDIVLVIPNYRLGPLGFLSTGDKIVPGNNGLKDLALALKWTKTNIGVFGGDSNKITVVGHSAGAAAAHHLMLSPLSRDLISGAIVQSGNAITGWSVARNKEEIKNSKRLAEFLNCTTTSNDAMIACLRQVKADDIIKQESRFLEWAIDPMIPFKPVVEPNTDGSFISQHPLEIIKSGKAANVPLLTGITTEEGAIKSASYYNNPQWIKDFDQDFNRVTPISLVYGNNNKERENMSNQLRKFYFGKKKIDYTTKSELTNLYTDVIFLMGADESVRLHAKYYTKPIYYYLFGYRGTESHSKLFGDPLHDYGVCHADELLYLFNVNRYFPDYIRSETDKKITDVLITLWTNFITTGNPTSEGSSPISAKWEPVKLEEDLNYLFIRDPESIEMAKGLHTERARFLQTLNLYSATPLTKSEL